MSKPPFKPGDRVRNTMNQPATVASVYNGAAGWMLAIQYDGSKTTVYRRADLFRRIRKNAPPPTSTAA